jgi:hypothetical protein
MTRATSAILSRSSSLLSHGLPSGCMRSAVSFGCAVLAGVLPHAGCVAACRFAADWLLLAGRLPLTGSLPLAVSLPLAGCLLGGGGSCMAWPGCRTLITAPLAGTAAFSPLTCTPWTTWEGEPVEEVAPALDVAAALGDTAEALVDAAAAAQAAVVRALVGDAGAWSQLLAAAPMLTLPSTFPAVKVIELIFTAQLLDPPPCKSCGGCDRCCLASTRSDHQMSSLTLPRLVRLLLGLGIWLELRDGLGSASHESHSLPLSLLQLLSLSLPCSMLL